MAWTYFIRKVNEKGAILGQSSAGQDEEPAPASGMPYMGYGPEQTCTRLFPEAKALRVEMFSRLRLLFSHLLGDMFPPLFNHGLFCRTRGGLERWLCSRVCLPLPEDPSSILSSHIRQLSPAWNLSSRGSDASGFFTHTNPYVYMIKNKIFFLLVF